MNRIQRFAETYHPTRIARLEEELDRLRGDADSDLESLRMEVENRDDAQTQTVHWRVGRLCAALGFRAATGAGNARLFLFAPPREPKHAFSTSPSIFLGIVALNRELSEVEDPEKLTGRQLGSFAGAMDLDEIAECQLYTVGGLKELLGILREVAGLVVADADAD